MGPMMKEIYVSTDVESDGPIPGPHPLLSFAFAAYTPDSAGVVAAHFAIEGNRRDVSGRIPPQRAAPRASSSAQERSSGASGRGKSRR